MRGRILFSVLVEAVIRYLFIKMPPLVDTCCGKVFLFPRKIHPVVRVPSSAQVA